MSRSYRPLIDWLKALGMLLILYGHLAGWAPLAAIPPIYSKQLGVAFFLFASGYSLSLETRRPSHVVFNRLFELFLFGIAVALIVTVVSVARGGRGNLSNYLPLLGGANVVFNNFPANPTSWYLGTYIHVILLWAMFFRRLRVTPAVLVVSLIAEIAIRALLLQNAGRYVAYMLVPNWTTVLLLGSFYGARAGRMAAPHARAPEARSGMDLAALAALAVSVAGWTFLAARLPFERAFPLMRLRIDPAPAGELLVSIMVSMVYLGVTWLVFRSVEHAAAPAAVRFVARNSLIIFLVHMPLYLAMAPWVDANFGSPWQRSAIYLTACLPGLALLSEGVRRMLRPATLRDRLYHRLAGAGRPLSETG